MPKYALFRNGVFAAVRDLPVRPDSLPHKLIAWHPVGAPLEGVTIGWAVVADEVIETIGLPGPPSTNPDDYPLQPFQFEAILEIMDRMAAGDAAIDAITDPTARAVARAKRRMPPSGVFHRSDPLFATLAPAVGLSGDEINAAWMQAKEIT